MARDLFARYFGGGIGHRQSRAAVRYFERQIRASLGWPEPQLDREPDSSQDVRRVSRTTMKRVGRMDLKAKTRRVGREPKMKRKMTRWKETSLRTGMRTMPAKMRRPQKRTSRGQVRSRQESRSITVLSWTRTVEYLHFSSTLTIFWGTQGYSPSLYFVFPEVIRELS